MGVTGVPNEELNQYIQDKRQEVEGTLLRECFEQELKDITLLLLRQEGAIWKRRGAKWDQEVLQELESLILQDPMYQREIRKVVTTFDLEAYQDQLKPIIALVFQEYFKGRIKHNHKHPGRLSYQEKMDDLTLGVVRLVSDGTIYYLTRHPALLTLYGEPLVDSDIKGILYAYDLLSSRLVMVEESELDDYDRENNVGSWIWFDVDNDAWYQLVYGQGDIKGYYTEGQTQGRMGVKLEKRSLDEEARLRKQGHPSRSAVIWQRQNLKGLALGEQQYANLFLKVKEDPQWEGLYQSLYQELEDLNQQLQVILAYNKKPTTHFILRKLEDKGFKRIEIIYNESIFRLSPYYMVNGTTGKVYLDRYHFFQFSKIKLPKEEEAPLIQGDLIIGPYLEKFINVNQLVTRQLPAINQEEYQSNQGLMERCQEGLSHPEEGMDHYGLVIMEDAVRHYYRLYDVTNNLVFNLGHSILEWENPFTHQPEILVEGDQLIEQLKKIISRFKKYPNITKGVHNLIKFLEEPFLK